VRRTLALLALFLIGFTASAAAAPNLTVPLAAPPGTGPLRLTLPAQVLSASRSEDIADLRLLDSTGRQLAMARVAPSRPTSTAEHPLEPMPVLERVGTLDHARLMLRVDRERGLRVAELEGALRTGEAPTVLALLFDTRTLTGGARRLRLDGDIPANQPVRVLRAAVLETEESALLPLAMAARICACAGAGRSACRILPRSEPARSSRPGPSHPARRRHAAADAVALGGAAAGHDNPCGHGLEADARMRLPPSRRPMRCAGCPVR
jgi:hypothetical protein